MTKFAPILAAVDSLKAKYAARAARLESAYSEANDGIAPTCDSQGRYHAPCDGYVLPSGWAELCLGDYDGRMFGRGEFLPVPCNDAEHEENRYYANLARPNYDYQRKVKARVSDIEELKTLAVRCLIVGQGKAWIDDSGNATAYAYLEGLKSIVESAAGVLDTLYNAARVKGPEVYLEGRLDVTGTIVATKAHNDPMYGASVKMLVTTEEGARLWGTMPRALPMDSQGKQVSFTATFSKGRDGMTYFKRPACAMILGE